MLQTLEISWINGVSHITERNIGKGLILPLFILVGGISDAEEYIRTSTLAKSHMELIYFLQSYMTGSVFLTFWPCRIKSLVSAWSLPVQLDLTLLKYHLT